MGQVGEPAHTHTTDIVVFCLCSWARCTHTWVKKCPQAQHSYSQGRVSTLSTGHIDTYIHVLVTSHAYGDTCVPIHRNGTHRATCARAPSGSQSHLHLFRSRREPLLMDSLQSFCPFAEAIPCFPCMPCNTARSRLCTLCPLPGYPNLCRSCFSLQAWLLIHTLLPALTTFQDIFFTLLGVFLQQPSASVLLLPFLLSALLLNFLLFIPTLFP